MQGNINEHVQLHCHIVNKRGERASRLCLLLPVMTLSLLPVLHQAWRWSTASYVPHSWNSFPGCLFAVQGYPSAVGHSLDGGSVDHEEAQHFPFLTKHFLHKALILCLFSLYLLVPPLPWHHCGEENPPPSPPILHATASALVRLFLVFFRSWLNTLPVPTDISPSNSFLAFFSSSPAVLALLMDNTA